MRNVASKFCLKVNFSRDFLEICGLRPRIKRHNCTFEDTSRKKAGPFSKVRSHNAAHLQKNRT